MKEARFYIVPTLGMVGSLAIWDYSGGGIYGDVVVALAGMCALVGLMLYSSKRKIAESSASDRKTLRAVLKRSVVLMDRGMRFESAVETAIGSAGKDNATDMFIRVLGFMNGGLCYNEAVAAMLRVGCTPEIRDTLIGMEREGSLTPDHASITAELYRIEHEHKLAMELKSGEMVRYTTAYMVSGTVVPSLVLLGFVGYSVLSFSLNAALALVCSILIFVPCTLCVIDSRIKGGLFGC